MLVYPCFSGDNADRVMHIQHDAYSTALWALFNYGVGRGLHAERLLSPLGGRGVAAQLRRIKRLFAAPQK